MATASLFWDSQPLTGVPADRLFDERFAHSGGQPAIAATPPVRIPFIVDGLSRLNPKLAMEAYPQIRDWLRGYEIVQQTGLSLIYHRVDH